ncbi:MAG: serine protease [Clostridia bacterium]|nr:serine protease [Clostridia bacterium]
MITNIFKRTVAVLMCAVVLLPLLVSCTADGLSAYDIAVKNGFAGSESEWLASLKGSDGKDGEAGKDGVDGKDFSALNTSLERLYAAAVSEGYKGTIEQYKTEVLGIADENGEFERVVNRSLLSAVSIIAYFQYRVEGSSFTNTSKGGTSATGFFYSIDKEAGDAYIVTNYHAVYDDKAKEKLSKEIYVYLYGQEYTLQQIPAQFVGGSATFDIAVLRVINSDLIKNGNVEAVKFRSSSDAVVGETVYTIGNAKSMGLSASVGVLTMDSMELEVPRADENGEVTMRLMRTDAPLNHGNSGGAFFDKDGNVLGVVVAKNVDDEVEGIGYIIPSDIARRAVENIIHSNEKYNSTTIKKCILGISVAAEEPYTEIEEGTGVVRRREKVIVKEIVPNSAAQGKVFPGDIILSIEVNGNVVKADRVHNIVDFMLGVYVGDTVKVTLVRDGKEMTVEIKFTESAISDIA